MSVVTTIVMFPVVDEPAANIEAFNEKLTKVRPNLGDRFRDIADVDFTGDSFAADFWGGSKFPEMWVWGAALNHIAGVTVIDVARDCNWQHPVTFVWSDENDDGWHVEVVSP